MMISLLKFLILIFWILDITNMPFMEMFDTTYPMNVLFWWLIWIFVLGFSCEISVRGDADGQHRTEDSGE